MRWRFDRAHPAAVLPDPQLEVLDRVVQLVAVTMMNGLRRKQRAAEMLLHYEAMLEHEFRLVVLVAHVDGHVAVSPS